MFPSKDELIERLVNGAKQRRAGDGPIDAVVATIVAIIGTAVAAYAVAAVIPGAFATLTAGLTGTDAGTALLKGVLFVVIALVIIILFFKLIPS